MTSANASANPVAGPRTIIETLLARAAATPGASVFAAGPDGLSWRELRDESLALSAGLALEGVGHGDRVAIALPDALDAIRAWLAVLLRRAVPLALDAALPPGVLARRVGALGCLRAIVDPGALIPLAAAALQADVRTLAVTLEALVSVAPRSLRIELPGPDDVACVDLDWPTDGPPAARVTTHRQLLAEVAAEAKPPPDLFRRAARALVTGATVHLDAAVVGT